MRSLKEISHALFGRHKPPQAPGEDAPVPQGEASHVPRDAVSREPGYSRYLLAGGTSELESQALHVKRLELLHEMRRMAETDPRVNRILYKLSADATENSFTVTVEDATGQRMKSKAQGVLDRCRYLINDKEKLRGWIESFLRDGDLFLQLKISPAREIINAQKLAAEMTFSRLNTQGEFPKGKKPYYQAKGIFDQQILREFEDWEIVHAKWRSEDGQPYGSPLFMAGQKTVKRVESGEDDMSIRRKLRAGLRFFFNVGTPDNPGSWEEVERFKEKNKDTLEKPVNAVSNIYGNGLMDMKAVQGDSELGNKEDIDHFEGLITMIGLTPSAMISGGRESGTNLNVIDSEEEDYSRTLMAICFSAEFGFLRPIFNSQLLLSDIDPDSIEYTLNWGAKGRESDYRKLQKATLWIRLGYSHETAYALADIDNGLTYEDELARIAEQKEQGIIPYTGPNVSRSNMDTPLDPEKTERETEREVDVG